MLIKRFSKLIIVVGPLLILGKIISVYFNGGSDIEEVTDWSTNFNHYDEIEPSVQYEPEVLQNEAPLTVAESSGTASPDVATADIPSTSQLEPWFPAFSVDDAGDPVVNQSVYREVFSASTPSMKYFSIDFGPDLPVMNPNIIPHPHQSDTWIVVAQRDKSLVRDTIFEEWFCNAVFQEDGSLGCITPPALLDVAPTSGDNCKGKLSHFALNVGPHDMRIFHGPHRPLAVFGSQSAQTCFGLFAQDSRNLIADLALEEASIDTFETATELQRPSPWGEVEKNWFLFWDTQEQLYVHHDIEPKRVFAQLLPDGSIGPDLGPSAGDEKCMETHMPKPFYEDESLHQATNSLSITLCKRSDSSCQPSDENTFVMTIFQHKAFHDWHGNYEPYVMLFRQSAPFSIHAISKKPIWIHGRGVLTEETAATWWKEEEFAIPDGHSEMFYVTSMSWKAHGQKYHGYLDDVLFVGFGIEDSRAAAIDILAGDILQDLGVCADMAFKS